MTGPQLEESAGFDRSTIDYIQRAAASGLYEIRGLGAKRRELGSKGRDVDSIARVAADLVEEECDRVAVGALLRRLADPSSPERSLYDTNLITQGFVFSNPNAKSTCGCGSSFGA